jgi:hypothetical protein
MPKGQNIANRETIFSVAEVAADGPVPFDLDRFHGDFASRETEKALQADVMEVRFRRIGRFPTLLLKTPKARGDF